MQLSDAEMAPAHVFVTRAAANMIYVCPVRNTSGKSIVRPVSLLFFRRFMALVARRSCVAMLSWQPRYKVRASYA